MEKLWKQDGGVHGYKMVVSMDTQASTQNSDLRVCDYYLHGGFPTGRHYPLFKWALFFMKLNLICCVESLLMTYSILQRAKSLIWHPSPPFNDMKSVKGGEGFGLNDPRENFFTSTFRALDRNHIASSGPRLRIIGLIAKLPTWDFFFFFSQLPRFWFLASSSLWSSRTGNMKSMPVRLLNLYGKLWQF